jgi:hypothetical protein
LNVLCSTWARTKVISQQKKLLRSQPKNLDTNPRVSPFQNTGRTPELSYLILAIDTASLSEKSFALGGAGSNGVDEKRYQVRPRDNRSE